MINKKFAFVSLWAIVFILASLASSVSAQAPETKTYEYTVLAPLPGTTLDPNCSGVDCKASLRSYIAGLFRLTIGLAAVVAVAYIIWGGILYITTDAIQGKKDGKDKILNAIYGLIMISISWLILYTINPRLLNFDLNIGGVSVPERFVATESVSNLQDARIKVLESCPGCIILKIPYLSPSDIARLDCRTCVLLSVPLGPNTNPNVIPELKSKLSNLNSVAPLTVTEAWPPLTHHVAECHFNGSCVDAVISSNTAGSISNFINKAASNELLAIYEVKSESERRTLISAGVPCANIITANITGPHFSVYSGSANRGTCP